MTPKLPDHVPSGPLPDPPAVIGIAASSHEQLDVQRLLRALRQSTDVAFVVVPADGSDAVLEVRDDERPVVPVSKEFLVEPNTIYTGMPTAIVTRSDGVLQVEEASAPTRAPLDTCFASIAKACGRNCIGIVFCPAAIESRGVQEIRAQGGLVVLVRDGSTALDRDHAGRLADHVVPLEQIPSLIEQYRQSTAVESSEPSHTRAELERLQRELAAMRESNAALRKINEDLQAEKRDADLMIEDLNRVIASVQLQADTLNEDLGLINVQLQHKIVELERVHNHLDNLLVSTDVAVLFLDLEHRIRWFSPRCARLLGLLPNDVGVAVARIGPGGEALAEVAQQILDGALRVEHILEDREGDRLYARLLPYRTHENAVSGVIVTLEHQRITKAVAAPNSSTELDARSILDLVDLAPVMLWTSDVEGHWVYCSRSWSGFCARPTDQLLGIGRLVGMHPADRARVQEATLRAVAEQRPYRLEYRMLRADGTYRWLLDEAVPRYEGGSFAGFVGGTLDITDHRLLQEELRNKASALTEGTRRKSEFIAMLGHELRNPLAALASAYELLSLDNLDEEMRERALRIIGRQLRQLCRFTDELLDVSRITQGKVALQQEDVDLRDVLRYALDGVESCLTRDPRMLTVRLPDQPLLIHGDLLRLTQVVANLLENAIKFTRVGGRIEVALHCDGGYAELKVRDDGQGIAPELLPRIFDVFAQSERTLDRPGGGLGLGLSVVRELVVRHGGSVDALSEGQGHGTTMVVRLPLLGKGEAAEARTTVREERGDQPLSFLVVEDNEDAADTLALLLQARGCHVEVAHDGPSALERVLAERFDVVLLDIGLPGMSGYEVASRLQDAPHRPLIVAVTGYGQLEDRERSQQAGFDHHLLKPVSIEAVGEIVRERLDRQI